MSLRLIEALRPLRHSPMLGGAAGIALFIAAFLVRHLAGGLLESAAFVTLLPAILIAGFVGGVQAGVLVGVLSLLAAWYFFLPPHDSWQVKGASGYVTLLLFAGAAIIQIAIVDALNRAVDHVSHERDRATVLFRELQHRVANNMAFLASLLRMQARSIASNPMTAVDAIELTEQRIHVMSRIHRRIYDPKIVDAPLQTYLKELVRDVLDAFEARHVASAVEAAPVALDLSRLITLSLLINEIVVNAIKHGFRGRDAGMLQLRIERDGSDLVMSICDDGRGFDADDVHNGNALGMMILNALAEQLRGTLSWSGGAGTTVRVVFPA